MDNNTKTKKIGFENKPENQKHETLEILKDVMELETDEIAKKKKIIAEDFENIKKELLILLKKNDELPKDMQLDIEEFDLNVDYRKEFKEKCKREREEYKTKILNNIKQIQAETKDILKNHWDTMFIKPRSIYCLKKLHKVDNYPISIADQEIINKANQIIEKRKLIDTKEEQYMSEANSDTTMNKYQLDVFNNQTLLSGSISYRLIDVTEGLNHQDNYNKLDKETIEDEIVLLHSIVFKLKNSFNKLFDEMFAEKQSQLDNLKEHNNKLNIIDTEFKTACKVEPEGPAPVDYEWDQWEHTERLTRVEDSEILDDPRFAWMRKQKVDVRAAEGEREARLAARYEFRRRALMDMMDGVLEKRWEDDLEKDVPKPKCMLTKNPEDCTKNNIKDVIQYNNEVEAKINDRLKYKKILKEKKNGYVKSINEIIENLDEKIFKLFQTKLKYNMAIKQEDLKIARLLKKLSDPQEQEEIEKTQIVVPQGNTEIRLTGHLSDFVDVAFVNKNDIKKINSEIEDMGKLKINTLNKYLSSKAKNRTLQQEAEILKLNQSLYKNRLHSINHMNVTKEINHYLVHNAKGIDIEKQAAQTENKNIAASKTAHFKKKKNVTERLDKVINEIKITKKKTKTIEKNIEKQNVKLSNLKSNVDENIADKVALINDTKFRNIKKRSEMMSKAQELQKEIIVLEKELELLKLRTFPSL